MRSETDRLALLVPAALELRGGPVAQRRMAPPEIVETFQETEDLATRLLAGGEPHGDQPFAVRPFSRSGERGSRARFTCLRINFYPVIDKL